MNSKLLAKILFGGLFLLFFVGRVFSAGFTSPYPWPQPPPPPAPPSVIVTYPTNGTVVTNPVIVVTGTVAAGDGSGISNIQSWAESAIGMDLQTSAMLIVSAWAQPDLWSYQATLVGGYNTVGVRAAGGDGLVTNGYSLVYFRELTPLTLTINGGGMVTPNLNGRILETTALCEMTAKPSAGYAFAGWSGDIVTNASTLSFAMMGNLVLQANFVPTPFASIAGTYHGTIAATAAAEDSVDFKTKISRDGRFTAKIQLRNATYGGGGNYSLVGAFAADGSYSGSFHRKKFPAYPVNLQLQLDINNRTISGTITDTLVNWTGALTAPCLKH